MCTGSMLYVMSHSQSVMMTWMRLIDRLARGDDSLGAKVIFVEKNICCGLKNPFSMRKIRCGSQRIPRNARECDAMAAISSPAMIFQ